MRILFVNEKCGYFGGVEQNVADASQLRSLGHACFLAWQTQTDRDPEGYAALFDGAARMTDGLEPLLARWRPDVVYFHKLEQVTPLLPACAGRLTVRMVHDHDLCCPRSHKYFAHSGRVCNQPAGWRCWADGAFVARARDGGFPIRLVDVSAKMREMRGNTAVDRLLVASRYMRDELVMNGFDSASISIVPPAVDVPATDYHDAPGSGRVLYVGQLIRGKGVDLLLQSMVGRAFSVDIVGIGNARTALESLTRRLGIEERVCFHGWVPVAAQADLYRQCDVAVVPSRWPEPFGMVGLQAMLHGRPMVAFNVGGIADWLDDGETGHLVPEQDIAAFGSAVQGLLDDIGQARRMGRAAFHRVRQRFSFTRYLRDLERVLTPGGALQHGDLELKGA